MEAQTLPRWLSCMCRSRSASPRRACFTSAIKNPVVTPVMHIEFVQQAMTKIVEKFGPRFPVRYVVDVSNNSAIAYMLANALPQQSLVGVRITGGESHAAGLVPMLVGDVGGRASSIPVMNLVAPAIASRYRHGVPVGAAVAAARRCRAGERRADSERADGARQPEGHSERQADRRRPALA